MGIAPFPLSNRTVLKHRLYDEYKIEIPLVPWQNKHFIRISIQEYNTQDDIEALINALQALLPQVAL
jgi:isopenicillin-N epimerase